MRFLPFLMTMLFLVACGKNSDSRSTPVAGGGPQLEEEAEDGCALESCNTITSDGGSVDLLDSVVDVPATVTATDITMGASKVSVAEGDKISCKTEVRAGEVYDYSISGDKLKLRTPNGSYSMRRLNSSGSGVRGTWVWKGKGEMGMHVIRTMSVVGSGRVILKTHCEL